MINLLKYIGSLFAGKPVETPHSFTARALVSTPPETISCYIAGIIKSIETEPEAWDVGEPYWSWGGVYRVDMTHRTVEAQIWAHLDSLGEIIGTSGDPIEWKALIAVLNKAPFPALHKMRLDREAAEEKTRKQREHFEALGCPDGSAVTVEQIIDEALEKEFGKPRKP